MVDSENQEITVYELVRKEPSRGEPAPTSAATRPRRRFQIHARDQGAGEEWSIAHAAAVSMSPICESFALAIKGAIRSKIIANSSSPN
jgi:hypothetical protein